MSRPLFPDDLWSFATGDSPEGPMLVRIRDGLPDAAARALYDQLVIVRWSFDPSANAGLPTGEEIEQMAALEEVLFSAFDEDCQTGCGVAVMTLPGTREWRFYARDTQDFVEAFNAALADEQSYPIGLEAFNDPEWIAFEELRPGMGG